MKENKYGSLKYGSGSIGSIINQIKSQKNVGESYLVYHSLNKSGALALIHRTPNDFRFINDKYKADKDIAELAMIKSPENYRYVSYGIKSHYHFMKKCIEKNPLIYCYINNSEDADKKLKEDRNIALIYLNKYPKDYLNIPEILRKDKDIFLFAFNKASDVVLNIHDSLIENDEVFNVIRYYVEEKNISSPKLQEVLKRKKREEKLLQDIKNNNVENLIKKKKL